MVSFAGSVLVASLDNDADASVVIVCCRESSQMAEATLLSMTQPGTPGH